MSIKFTEEQFLACLLETGKGKAGADIESTLEENCVCGWALERRLQDEWNADFCNAYNAWLIEQMKENKDAPGSPES